MDTDMQEVMLPEESDGRAAEPAPVTEEPELVYTPLELKRDARTAGNRAGAAALLCYGFSTVFSYVLTLAAAVTAFLGDGSADIFYDPTFNLLINAVYSPFIMLIPFLIAHKFSHRRLSELMSYSRPKRGLSLPFVLFGLGAAMLGNIISNMLANLMTEVGIPPVYSGLELPNGLDGFLLSVLVIAVFPALFEEFACRGVMLGMLADKTSASSAIFVSAMFFGLMHGNFVQIPFAFIVGLALALAYVKTGSMWVPMAIHFLNNFFSVVLDYLTADMSEGLQSVISALYFILACGAALIGALLLARRSPDFLSVREGPRFSDVKATVRGTVFAPCMIIAIVLFAAKAVEYQLSSSLLTYLTELLTEAVGYVR